MEPDETNALMRLMLGLLLFRLGGEQTFTLEEYEYITKEVAGVQIHATAEGGIILRTRGHEAVEKAMENGSIL